MMTGATGESDSDAPTPSSTPGDYPDFRDVVYFVHSDVVPAKADKIRTMLTRGGAREWKPTYHWRKERTERLRSQEAEGPLVTTPPSWRFDPDVVTHVICTSLSIPEYEACGDPQADGTAYERDPKRATLVTPSWVARSYTLGDRQSERYFSPDPRRVFSGVVVHLSHISLAESELVLSLVLALGGTYRMQLTKEVTHLLTPTLESSKLQALRTGPYQGWEIHILHPAWIYACVEAGRAVSKSPFLWHLDREESPAFLSQPQELPRPAPTPEPASMHRPRFVRPTRGRRMIDSDPHALQGLKVLYVGRSIDSLPPAAAVEMLAAYVQSHGGVWVPPEGQIEKAVEQADVVISSVRDSAAGYWALCGGKRLATLEWLWDVSFRGVLTEPTGSILHFPPSRRAIEGMESAVFSLSGYKGARRIYLKHLIRLAGAHWTPELTRQNTHLLAVSWRGDKVAAARSWGIPIVTHRWLEMCIQQWAVPPLDQFGRQESQSDLERLGELPIDPDALEAWVEEAQTWARKQRGGKEERPKRRRALARSESTESGRTRRKRTGSAPAPSSTQYYVTTGTELKPAQEQALRRLGWQKEDAVGERTNVLVAERLTRTEKMLCAVARGLPIVRVEWAEQMTAQGKLLAPEAFALEDRAGEKQRGVKLADALAARRARGQGLLAGHTIYLTPRSRLEPVLRAIIEAAGGTAHRTPIDVEHIQADPKHRHMVSSGDDRRAWAAHAAAGLPVWSAELILDGVLRQRLSWRRHRLAN